MLFLIRLKNVPKLCDPPQRMVVFNKKTHFVVIEAIKQYFGVFVAYYQQVPKRLFCLEFSSLNIISVIKSKYIYIAAIVFCVCVRKTLEKISLLFCLLFFQKSKKSCGY